MPNDLLVLRLSEAPPTRPSRTTPQPCATRPISTADLEALAALYRNSYPADVGAADLDQARAEIEATFAGEFGELLDAASIIAEIDGAPVGAILTTNRSIWDADLDCPFVIDFFVDPALRGKGVGRTLLSQAIDACRTAGRSALALRFGQGTSVAAQALYQRVGFRP